MMWSSQHTVRVLAKGGILTPSHLLKILEVVKSSGNKHVNFGSRQDLLFHVHKKETGSLKEAFRSIQTDFIIHGNGESIQNIVSSYVSSDMVAGTSWLTSGNYLNILENFNFLHKLRVNIADPKQSLVPLFYGHLNFVASGIKDYWYLFIRRNYSALPECWPVLILNNDIAALSKAIENQWPVLEKGSIYDLFERIQNEMHYNGRRIEAPFKAEIILPQDYEGFGRMYHSENYWAGFYWRNNCYDIAFLEEVCFLCLKTGISKICLTSWKSFLIKEIRENDLLSWQQLLGRFGINMRHSSFELNWHVPLKDNHALKLKHFLVKEFDKVDISVHGLTFGIKTKPEPTFCTIQIERNSGIPFLNSLDVFKSYKVMHAKHFNANTCEYEEYASDVPRLELPRILNMLTRKYYAQLNESDYTYKKQTKTEKTEKKIVHQCLHCLTVYDTSLNGLSFVDLPESYTCPLCDAKKAEFKPVFLDNMAEVIQESFSVIK